MYPVFSASGTLGIREDSVISAFSTLETREDQVIPACGTLGTHEASVISVCGTLETQHFKTTRTRESMSPNDSDWYSDDVCGTHRSSGLTWWIRELSREDNFGVSD